MAVKDGVEKLAPVPKTVVLVAVAYQAYVPLEPLACNVTEPVPQRAAPVAVGAASTGVTVTDCVAVPWQPLALV